MAVPSYTEDLTDVDLAEADTNWSESSDANWDDGGAPTADSDYPYIQDSTAITQQATKASIASLFADNGGAITLPTDGAYFVWQFFASSTGLDSYANGGMRVMVGSSDGDFYSWDVGGVDFGRNPYGGWMNHAVNTTVSSDDTVGTPGATEQFVGAAVKTLVAIGKGNPHGVDAIRYGRGSSIFENGSVGDGFCTFAGYAAQNDNTVNRWGLIQAIAGGYLYKGKMTIGTGGTAADFEDSNVSILIDNTPKVTANFNTIEVNNASTRVNWTNIVFTSLGTASPGRLVCNADADITWDSCQFLNMGAFAFGGTNSTCTKAIWSECGAITGAGGTFNESKVLLSAVAADTSAFGWNVNTDPDGYTDDMTFSKGTNAHHAIELGTSSPTTVTFRGLTSTGFNAADEQNDSFFHVLRDSGTVTINVVGGTGNFKYKSAGATVVVVPDAVTVAVHATDINGGDIQNARVFLKAKDGTGPFPFEETVTIVNSGTTATVTHSTHGMASNDYVYIKGASHWQNNGAFQITVSDASTYTYTMPSDPGSSPSGTIKSTFVALTGLTDINGDKSIARVYSSNQPVTGWIRLTPTYKSAPLFGTIGSTDGYSSTGVLIDD